MNPAHTRVSLHIVINSDLNLSLGKIISQITHLLHRILIESACGKIPLHAKWMQSGETTIILKSSERKIVLLLDKLKKNNIPHWTIRDAGKTQVSQNALTVLGFGFSHNTPAVHAISREFNLF